LLSVDSEGAIRSLLCGALLADWTTIAGVAEFTSPVVRVLDGDRLEVLHFNHLVYDQVYASSHSLI
jgi:hypothetical protein